MRIVHVVQSLGLGGQERLVLHLSRELRRRGHEVAVVSLTPGGSLKRDFESSGDRFVRVVELDRKEGFDAVLPARLAVNLLALRPDVVHTHNPSPMLYAVPIARAIGVHAIVHTKHGANIYGSRSLHAARLVARMTTAFVGCSQGTAVTARAKEHVPPRLLRVIPNGIPLGDFDAAARGADRARVRLELGIPEHAIVVGTVGRLAPEKDQALLMAAVAPMLSDDFHLVLVGDGPERAALEERAAAHAPFVHLVGLRSDIPAVLASFDVFALTSKTEGLPLVIPEAMAGALPVVATAVGGVPDIVPPSVGILAHAGDRESLERAFRRLAGDSDERRRMGEAASAYARAEFSIETMTDRYLELYARARRS
jgi:glycosyltransferase involved in cell wall biosynthesis